MFKHLFFLISLILHASCGFKVSSTVSFIGSRSGKTISGIISPFFGSIVDNGPSSYFISTATAALCTDPVYAKLFALEGDGSIDENNPLSTQLIGPNARYSFDVKSLGISPPTSNVQFLVKAEGCNSDVYKRPVTNFDNKQSIDAKSTVIAEVVNANSLITRKLNQASRADIENLINSVSGTSTSAALNSLISGTNNSTMFTKIFGSPPSIIYDASPEVKLVAPTSSINELAVNIFSMQLFHVDPSYSFAYSWKIDGVVKSTSANWNYIPSANESGAHTIDLYVGKNDGSGNIDLSKPYYTKSTEIIVNNNMFPTPPNMSINASTPNPRNTNSVSIDLSTGVSLANCTTFSHMAITDTPSIPGILQFNIDCHNNGTQTEIVVLSTGDGAKTIYLWAIDNEGNISNPKTVSLVLDTLPPTVSLNLGATNLKGGATQTLSFSASDAGVGLNSLVLYFSTDNGVTYSLVSNLSNSASSYDWPVPAIDTVNGKLKLEATDLTSSITTVYSSTFTIDSTAPSSPTITRTTNATSNSAIVAINTTCSADYSKILYSQTGTAPSLSDSAWENCTSTKNFTVTPGDGLKTLYAFTRDAVGNISNSSNITMILDTTAPSAPVANLSSASISNSSFVSFTVTDCLDRPFVLVSESIIAPAVNDLTWQTCSSSAGAIGSALVGPVLQGTHNLYVYAKDAIGNVSPSTSASMIYDTTNPTLSLSTPLGPLYKGGDIVSLNFSANDTFGLSSLRLEYAADGSTYSLASTLATNATTFTWTVPGDNTSTAKIRLVAEDNAMTFNSTTIASTTFTIDSTPPTSPTMTLLSDTYTNSTSIDLSISSPCSSDATHLLIKEGTAPFANDAGWTVCASLTGAQTYGLANIVNGTHAIKIYAKDSAENITLGSTVNVNYDTIPPAFSITSSFIGIAGGSSNTLTWTLTEANASDAQLFSIEIYDGNLWNTITTHPLTNGPHSATSFSKTFLFPSYNTIAAKTRISYSDLAGNSNSITSADFTIDSTAPTSNSISINSNANSTNNKNVLVSFDASDTFSDVSSFCIKYNSITNPLIDDSCWIPLGTIGVAPAPTINVLNFPFQLGSIQGDYDVRVWIKDSVGNISTLTNSGAGSQGYDLYTMGYTPDPAPVITNFTGSSTDSPASPLLSSDTTITLGNDVYVKWNITDNVAIASGSISLYYTTNDSTYTLISNGLDNSINESCTLTPGHSGCYRWSAASPSNAYYRIKLVVTDSGGATVYEVSNPINTGAVNFLSGNTSLGIGGMATNSILIGYGESAYNDSSDPQAIAVTKTGFIFYRYYGRGLVYISPQDGILRDLALTTGTMSGDGSNVLNATFKSLGKITKDYNDNILLWDFDRIRKINTSTTPWTITTLFGGGADSSDGALGLSASITSSNNDTLTPTPNGKIYFYKGLEIWYYDPTDLKVKKYKSLSGTGTGDMLSFRATLDNVACPGSNSLIAFNNISSAITKIIRRASSSPSALCGSTAVTLPYYNTNFNLSTGVAEAPHPPQSFWSSIKFTGLDGNIYELEQGRSRLKKYSVGTNTFTTVIGTGTVGRCIDGTAATLCNAVVMSAFVTELGKVYFIDLGVLRTIDSAGNIQTIAGQPRNFGIGSNPISARYSQINFFDVNGDDIFIKNELENQIIKFSLTGGNLIHIGGNTIKSTPINDTDAKLTPLPGCSWGMPCSFIVDGINNRLYHYGNSPGGISYIDLNTGKWVLQSTSGLQDGGTRVSYLGLNSDGLITYLPAHYGVSGNKVTLRVVNQSTLASTLIYGQNTTLASLSNTLCNDLTGTDAACTINHTMDASIQTRYKFDSTTNNWLIGIRGTTTISKIPSLGGTISVFKTLANTYASYDFYKSGVDDYIFYCGINGNLYKKNLTTDAETLLSLPISTMKCTGGNIHYQQGRNSLIFAYVQNGLYGMAEYMNP